MIKKNYTQIFTFAVCALLVPHALYGYTQVSNDIELTVNDYADNPGEVLVYGSRPITAAQFLQKGIHPVKLKISNKSSDPVIISPKSVFKELVGVENAARMFHVDNQWTSSLLLDACLLATGVNIATMCMIPPMIIITLWTWFPGNVIGAIYWFNVRGKNKQLNQDFIRALAEQHKNGECVIQPGSSATKILLLKQDHRLSRFTFRVFDEQNKQFVASFEVALDQ